MMVGCGHEKSRQCGGVGAAQEIGCRPGERRLFAAGSGRLFRCASGHGQPLGTLDSIFNEAAAFAHLNHYHYFKVAVQRFPENVIEQVDEAHIPWARDFQSAKAVVLEINPLYVTGRHPLAFLDAALAAKPNSVTTATPVAVVTDEAGQHAGEHGGADR